ncbi:hypothetical protein PINS_up013880 [Pythium insidiosum]|nr:hypothetical protein PINS_up013880 [Pythium insidiosum]
MDDVTISVDSTSTQRRKHWSSPEEADDMHEDRICLLKPDESRPEELPVQSGAAEAPTASSHTKRQTERKTRSTTTAASAGQPHHGSQRPKVLFLDGLRGLAAIFVVTQHANFMGDRNLGACAVDTFFVLSAFLLTMLFERQVQSLLRREVPLRSWVIALADYAVKRFLRVYPLFAIVAIVLRLLSVPQRERLFHVKRAKSYDLFKTLTFDEWFRPHVFWTLPLEITYYLILPLFVVGMVRLRHLWWLPVGPTLVWIIHSGLYTFRTSHQSFGPHFPTFITGSLGAIVYARLAETIERNEVKWHRIVLRCIEYTTLALLLSVAFNGLLFTWIHPNPAPRASGFQFISVHVTIIIVCEMLLPGPIASILEWSLLRYVGKISFSVYLLHSFVIYSDAIARQSYYDRVFAIAAAVGALATLSYHIVEEPSQRLAVRISQQLKRIDASGSAMPTTDVLPRVAAP